ncbi:hypothetical protein OSB04_031412 [Centaurea solstitialis]|uniref:Auxin-responsive protein n=1 Tax=Centaurea solstitialis TaxID=347529 RepID=A0AA38S8X0_9ASTR|nr:hypothetical protein OSB04_031412 [Centaurea solstitialis]
MHSICYMLLISTNSNNNNKIICNLNNCNNNNIINNNNNNNRILSTLSYSSNSYSYNYNNISSNSNKNSSSSNNNNNISSSSSSSSNNNNNKQQQLPLQHPTMQQIAGNGQSEQNANSANRVLIQPSSAFQESQFHQEQPSCILQRPQQTQLQQAPFQSLQHNLSQAAQQSLSEQQQQQLQHQLAPVNQAEPQFPLHQQLQQTHQSRQQSLSQQQLSGNSFSTSTHLPFPKNQVQNQPRQMMPTRAHSDGDAPSCSTSPSTNNCQLTPLNKNQPGPSVFVNDSIASKFDHDLQSRTKSNTRLKQEATNGKLPKYKTIANEQLEPSTSVTSYSLDAGNFPIPNFCVDNDDIIQPQTSNSFPLATNINGLPPDALLSRGFDSQNLLSSFCGAPRDIDTELSSAVINPQPFGMPDMSFKPGCSNDVAVRVEKNDVAVNDSGVLGNGLWGNQAQRVRTYTKVQKRGSVGRTIDVTRYMGYEELRHDLARMFGIEGQLEDAQRTDWKLVYVDHENDILLVGDDPWEEFVSCVQSIKILSYSEVQKMSLDGDLGNMPLPNQAASSGTDGGNLW